MNLDRTEIRLCVRDLQKEVAFFERLGFRAIPLKTRDQNDHTLLTDGEMLFGLYRDSAPSPAVTVYLDDLNTAAQELRDAGLEPREGSAGSVAGLELTSPAGVSLFLLPADTMDYPDRAEAPSSRVGVFGELAIPVPDYATEARFWEAAGFKVMGDVYEQPERWAIHGARTLPIGLHQTDRFSDHALTFFSPAMGEMLVDLQRSGPPLEWEGRGPNDELAHGVVKSPSGHTVYLFTGDLTKM